jgi:CxxC motif-containing protein
MIKKLVCIECPQGCVLSVDIENGRMKSVSGEKCPKGKAYAAAETEDPVRILTATVLTEGLDLKLVPVRTNRPIPKKELARAMEEIGRLRIKKPVAAGDVVVDDFLGLGVKLVATREAAS